MKLSTKMQKLLIELKHEKIETSAFIFPCGKSGQILEVETKISCNNCNILENCVEYFVSQPGKGDKIMFYKTWLKHKEKHKMRRSDEW